jgi:hypothetical protein
MVRQWALRGSTLARESAIGGWRNPGSPPERAGEQRMTPRSTPYRSVPTGAAHQ